MTQRTRRYLPLVCPLESRRLLSFTVSDAPGQTGVDLVGPDASQGGDGIQDLGLQLSGIHAGWTVDRILVTPEGGAAVGSFAWQTQPNSNGNNVPGLGEYGYSMAEFVASSGTTGDLYINPQVQSVAPAAGTGSPISLGGSTGPLVGLQNGDWLTVTVNYQNTTITDSDTFQVEHLRSAALPVAAIATPPAATAGGMTVTDHGQDDPTGHPGMVHLTVTAPRGATFNPADFTGGGQGSSTSGGLVFTLSDQAGLEWDSLLSEVSHNHLDTIYKNSKTVELYFPPLRTEAPSNGASATLTFQATIPGNPAVFVKTFKPAGSGYNLGLLYSAQAGTATASTEAELDAYLGNSNPMGTVYLSTTVPNQTIVVNQPLQITHSVTIIGQGVTILFDQNQPGGNTAPWPATATGAIYVNFPPGTVRHIQVTLAGFTIRFAGRRSGATPRARCRRSGTLRTARGSATR